MNFKRFNKNHLFTVDTTDFKYFSLEDLYKRDGENTLYLLCGLYINTKSQYDPEAPTLATDSELVNLPVFQLDEVKEMREDEEAVEAINNGEAGFTIESYTLDKYPGRTFYKAIWCNYDED